MGVFAVDKYCFLEALQDRSELVFLLSCDHDLLEGITSLLVVN